MSDTPRRHPFGRGRLAARVLALVIDIAAAIGGRLPAGLTHAVAVVGGNLEWMLRPGTRRRLATNLAHAVGGNRRDHQVRSLVHREMVNEARRSADLLWSIDRPADFLRTVDVRGIDNATAAAAGGRGVILAGLHVGGWEVATAVPAAVLPVPTTVIVADDWLAWAIQHVRVAAGLRVLHRDGSALPALRLLRAGQALLILGDDAYGAHTRTYRVELCGSAVSLPAGVVSLSRLAGAPIVPFEVLPVGPRRWRVDIATSIDPPQRHGGEEAERRTLQLLADHWSDVLRRCPEHWAARFPIGWEDDG